MPRYFKLIFMISLCFIFLMFASCGVQKGKGAKSGNTPISGVLVGQTLKTATNFTDADQQNAAPIQRVFTDRNLKLAQVLADTVYKFKTEGRKCDNSSYGTAAVEMKLALNSGAYFFNPTSGVPFFTDIYTCNTTTPPIKTICDMVSSANFVGRANIFEAAGMKYSFQFIRDSGTGWYWMFIATANSADSVVTSVESVRVSVSNDPLKAYGLELKRDKTSTCGGTQTKQQIQSFDESI
ncbi:MAG: hypothetical protein WCG27_07170 [Pseudomonadota bacterium]